MIFDEVIKSGEGFGVTVKVGVIAAEGPDPVGAAGVLIPGNAVQNFVVAG